MQECIQKTPQTGCAFPATSGEWSHFHSPIIWSHVPFKVAKAVFFRTFQADAKMEKEGVGRTGMK